MTKFEEGDPVIATGKIVAVFENFDSSTYIVKWDNSKHSDEMCEEDLEEA